MIIEITKKRKKKLWWWNAKCAREYFHYKRVRMGEIHTVFNQRNLLIHNICIVEIEKVKHLSWVHLCVRIFNTFWTILVHFLSLSKYKDYRKPNESRFKECLDHKNVTKLYNVGFCFFAVNAKCYGFLLDYIAVVQEKSQTLSFTILQFRSSHRLLPKIFSIYFEKFCTTVQCPYFDHLTNIWIIFYFKFKFTFKIQLSTRGTIVLEVSSQMIPLTT